MATAVKKEAKLTVRLEKKLRRRAEKKVTRGRTLSQVVIAALEKGLALMEAEEATTQPA